MVEPPKVKHIWTLIQAFQSIPPQKDWGDIKLLKHATNETITHPY